MDVVDGSVFIDSVHAGGLNRYERVRLIGIRMQQIMEGAPSMAPVTNPEAMAWYELEHDMLPIRICSRGSSAPKRSREGD